MQRIINDPNMVVEDMLKGFEKCHRDILHVDEHNPRVVISNSFAKQKKVGIVTGGEAVISQPSSAIAESIWWMPWQWEKSFPHRPQRASMTVSVQWIRAWG